MPKEKIPKKMGRPCPFTEERYQQHLQAHCEMLEAMHKYYLEFEDWESSRSFNSSRRQYYWLMRMQKQIKTRLLQIKQFQNSRDPKFDPEIYRKAYYERIAREQAELEKEMKDDVDKVRNDLGL